MGFFADFKKFVMRGNVVDLAVGVIIGAAFGGITKSLVDDVMMPPIGLALGAVDFKEMYVPLVIKDDAKSKYTSLKSELFEAENGKRAAENAKRAAEKPPLPPLSLLASKDDIHPTLDQMNAKGVPALRYGLFINTIINFLFVAFGVFLVVKLMSVMQKKDAPPLPGPTKSEELLAEIRDTLKGQKAR